MSSRCWIQTYSGKRFDLVDPRPDMVVIEDIAHALSQVNRYCGHTRVPYSVAQHSVLVSHVVSQEDALAGLLHDAAEAYVNDLSAPLKRLPALQGYDAIEERILRVIFERYEVAWPIPSSVHEADKRMLLTEIKAESGLLGKAPAEWGIKGEPYSFTIKAWSPDYAESMFLGELRWLMRGRP